ncbi:MAG: SIS domain-containing protein [Thermoproteota archaeon]
MITEGDIARVDHNKIHLIYEKWPEHFQAATDIKFALDHDRGFYDSIVLCGMGGSATSCDILNDVIHNDSNITSSIVRDHRLPSIVSKRTLIIANSVSGNTVETVQAVKAAFERNAEVICISAGGKLKELAEKNGQKHIEIPNLSVPRVSLPYLLMPALKLIDPLLKTSVQQDIQDMLKNLVRIRKEISAAVPEQSNIAKKIASFLNNGFAFCFTSPYLVSAGTRFKNSLNENAKVHCLRESVFEASHNEIVPFSFNYDNFNPKVVLLGWAQDENITKERFEKVRAFFQDIRQPLMVINSFERSLLNAIISSIYILDYSTIYMAVARNIDPSPTPAIDILKKV